MLTHSAHIHIAHTHTKTNKPIHMKCRATLQYGDVARKTPHDRLIDPTLKMGNIPPASISIKAFKLEAAQISFLFLFELRGGRKNP